jgi:hypothetical protein
MGMLLLLLLLPSWGDLLFELLLPLHQARAFSPQLLALALLNLCPFQALHLYLAVSSCPARVLQAWVFEYMVPSVCVCARVRGMYIHKGMLHETI